MKRTRFYNEVVVNNVKELDWLNHTLSKFKLSHDENYYITSVSDVGRPDLISFKNYGGDVGYWWIICLVNGIQNPLTDITIGMKLKIPHILDINAFQRKYKLR
jgi:hypothetical protein